MDKQEIWRPVVGYEGYYEVSNFGYVRSLDRYANIGYSSKRLKIGRRLKAWVGNNGYYMVSLSKNNKVKKHTVHRLVAEAFIPNPNNYPVINHRDENRLNNFVKNIEWCTQKYNMEYSNVIEKGIEKQCWKKANEVTSKPVIQYTKDGKFVAEFESVNEAQRKTGVNISQISKVCTNKKGYKSAGGYKWSYK